MDLHKAIEAKKFDVADSFFENIKKYKQILQKWNKTHNLTGVQNEKELDSFILDAIYPLLFIKTPKRLLDIGSGAGFPGLILAMALPSTEVVLCEPLAKRASFLHFVASTLALKNVKVVRKRVEELEDEVFDLITSRAVTNTTTLLEISKHLRDERTKLLFYKGQKVFEEVDSSLPHKVIIANNRHYLLIDQSLKSQK